MVIGFVVDSLLARHEISSKTKAAWPAGTQIIDSKFGKIRVQDTGGEKPVVIMAPDGPCVIEHYQKIVGLLSPQLRVVCFDLPGFGFSFPSPIYTHSLKDGGEAVLAVMDSLQIQKATLAFSCANGFYALEAAKIAPERVESLFLSQTPSLQGMQGWSDRVVPAIIRKPVIGQLLIRFNRLKTALRWYDKALPSEAKKAEFEIPATTAIKNGACFSLASVVQGLQKEPLDAVNGVPHKCTSLWGKADRSHKKTPSFSLLENVPQASITEFDTIGHFPDLENPEQFCRLLLEHLNSK